MYIQIQRHKNAKTPERGELFRGFRYNFFIIVHR